MPETIDDISIDWTDEEGVQKVRELKKEVLTRGAWATLMDSTRGGLGVGAPMGINLVWMAPKAWA